MKKYKFKISGHSYEVEIDSFTGENAVVSVNGTPYEVEIESDQSRTKTPTLARKAVVNQVGEGEIKKTADNGVNFKVTAPLPGSISKINVAVGDTVKVGDCLLVMEAMKMENNISAEKGGVVKSIKVSLGAAVLQGDTLMEIA